MNTNENIHPSHPSTNPFDEYAEPGDPSDARRGRRGPSRVGGSGPDGWGHGHWRAMSGGRPGGRGGPWAGGPGGRGGPFGRGRRMRRGEVRSAILQLLVEQDGHGYELIQALEDKTDGAWRPSPGSVYPTLQLLEDTGLVTSADKDGKRVYSITDEGRTEAARLLDDAGAPPWADVERGGGLRGALGQLAAAVRQVGMAGTDDQIERALVVITTARKDLYRILAED